MSWCSARGWHKKSGENNDAMKDRERIERTGLVVDKITKYQYTEVAVSKNTEFLIYRNNIIIFIPNNNKWILWYYWIDEIILILNDEQV